MGDVRAQAVFAGRRTGLHRLRATGLLCGLAVLAALLLHPLSASAISSPANTLTGALVNGDALPNTEALRAYGLWGEDLVNARVAPVHAAGKVPILSLKDGIKGGTWRGPSWAEICSGAGADYLQAQLSALGSVGYPVWFTFDHEPDVIVKNDPSGGATASAYACAFRTIQGIAADLGVTNIKWYSALLVPAYRDGSAADFIAGVHLDAAGIDLYMYGPLDSGDAACQPARIAEAEAFARARGLPLALPEWGVSANVMTDAQRATCIDRWATWHDGWADSPFLIYFSPLSSPGPLNTRIGPGTAAYAAYGRASGDTAPPADTTPPTVTLRAPLAGATVTGTLTVTADVADDTGVDSVTLAVDGSATSRNATAPYTPASITWDSTGVSDGPHTLRIVARDAAGNSGGDEVTVEVANNRDTQPPSAPSGLQAVANGQNGVRLDWSAARDNVGVTGYQISRDGRTQTTVTGTSYTDAGLDPGSTYQYSVVAFDAAGNRSDPALASATTDPAAVPVPTGLAAIATGTTAVSLSWSSGDSTVTGYRLYRDGTQVATPGTPSYDDSGLTAATTYRYQVAAVGPGGRVSDLSAAVSVTTSRPTLTAPTGLVASAITSTSVTVSWSANSADQAVTGYRVYRDGALVASPTSTSYSDSALRPATSYSYTVAAYSAASTSPASAALRVTTSADRLPPSIPGSPRAASTTPYLVTMTWSASTDAGGSTVASYRVYRGSTLIATVPAGSTNYPDTTVSAGTKYSYRVAAVDSAGNASAKSASVSATTAAAKERTAPSTPSGLRVTAVTSTSITFGWTAAKDNVKVAGYHVYRNGTYVGDSSTASFQDTGLQPRSTYSYYVVAFDTSANRSANSSTLRATSGG